MRRKVGEAMGFLLIDVRVSAGAGGRVVAAGDESFSFEGVRENRNWPGGSKVSSGGDRSRPIRVCAGDLTVGRGGTVGRPSHNRGCFGDLAVGGGGTVRRRATTVETQTQRWSGFVAVGGADGLGDLDAEIAHAGSEGLP